MKRNSYMFIILLVTLILAGCAKQPEQGNVDTSKTVAEVLEKNINEVESNKEIEAKDEEKSTETKEESNVLDLQGIEKSKNDKSSKKQDTKKEVIVEQVEPEKKTEKEIDPVPQEDESVIIVVGEENNQTADSLDGPPEILFSELENKEGIVDLTTMNDSMVYAILNQLMIAPKEYIGKTIVMEGTYESMYDEFTKMYYHYAIITDSLACCSQGLEFVWEDGSHAYPEEYPKLGEGIRITGVFETYKVEGQDYVYSRLNNSTMERIN